MLNSIHLLGVGLATTPNQKRDVIGFIGICQIYNGVKRQAVLPNLNTYIYISTYEQLVSAIIFVE